MFISQKVLQKFGGYDIFQYSCNKNQFVMDRNDIINSIRQIGQTTLPRNSSLLLFGSQARGDAHEGSDWDILILLDKPKISLDDYEVGYPFRELGWSLGEEINPQVYSKEEWSKYSFTPFYKNVEHDKQVLL
jgi:predicted nucleotidyltransferase